MSEEQDSEDTKRIKAAAVHLSEFFDSVQIVCTRYNNDTDGTMASYSGVGNWFARYGSVKEWIKVQEAEMATREYKDDEEEGGEEGQ